MGKDQTSQQVVVKNPAIWFQTKVMDWVWGKKLHTAAEVGIDCFVTHAQSSLWQIEPRVPWIFWLAHKPPQKEMRGIRSQDVQCHMIAKLEGTTSNTT